MSDLIERLKQSEGPDRELDKEIWQLLVPNVTRRTIHVDHHVRPYDIDETRDASGRLITVPSYTASLDAIRALIKEALPSCWSIRFDEADPEKIDLGSRERPGQAVLYVHDRNQTYENEAETPELAACIALLQAVQATGETGS